MLGFLPKLLVFILMGALNPNPAAASNSSKCGHIEYEGELIIEQITRDSRILESNIDYAPIRIYVDFTAIETNQNVSDTWLRGVHEIFDNTIDMLQNLIKVKPLTTQLKLQSSTRIKYTVPTYLTREGVNADLVLIAVVSSDTDTQTEAWSMIHSFSSIDMRPVSGVIGLSPTLVTFTKANYKSYLSYLLLHEITHILAMSPVLFNNYWNEESGIKRDVSEVLKKGVIINGIARTLISTPKVVAAAQKHFNCTAISGVEVENQGDSGSAGSHWESRTMLGDYMIATSYPDIFISEITLALFEDSGWYRTNNYTGGLFKYGKNAGCSFFNSKCVSDGVSSFPDFFCTTNNAELCMAGNKYKAICKLYTYNDDIDVDYRYFTGNKKEGGGLFFADYCPVPLDTSYSLIYYGGSCNIGSADPLLEFVSEKIGANSGCFVSSLIQDVSQKGKNLVKTSICYEYYCDASLASVVIKLNSVVSITCPPKGGNISIDGYAGEVICPNYNKYCTSSIQCYDIKDCVDKTSFLIPPVDLNLYIKNVQRDDQIAVNSQASFSLSQSAATVNSTFLSSSHRMPQSYFIAILFLALLYL